LSCDFSSSFDVYCKKPDLGTPDTLDPLLLKRDPEELNRSRLFQADLWSLGIVIFFCIAKKYPIDLLQLSDMDKNFGSHIKNNYNNEDFWNRRDILNVFEITKQFHRKVESLNKQTHIKDAKKYSSATLEELLSLDPTKRTLHIVDEHPPSKESKKKTATPIVHTVASVSEAIEAIESKGAIGEIGAIESKKTKKRKSKPKTLAPIPEGAESFRAV
jgi:serine/threonine protein kinase